MIEAKSIEKRFGDVTALSGVNMTLERGRIYGLVGSNGAGKSTLLRVLCGIYAPDEGTVSLDGEAIYNNPLTKSRIVFVPDELYFLPGTNLKRMAGLYASVYPTFDEGRFLTLLSDIGLDYRRPISQFSKGMKRQASTCLALAVRSDFLFFDETFDGLDPVMRNYMKRIISEDVLSREATALITSHSLRELEDTCDQLAMLHRGGMVLASDLPELRTRHIKVQIGFREPYDESCFSGISMARFVKHGSVSQMILSGDTEEALARLRAMEPVLLDVLPLSLEEVFTYELENLGYRFDEKEVRG